MPLNVTVTTLWMKGNHFTGSVDTERTQTFVGQTFADGHTQQLKSTGRLNPHQSQRPSPLQLFIDKSEILIPHMTPPPSHLPHAVRSRLLHDVDIHRREEALEGLKGRGQPVFFRAKILFHHTFCDLHLNKMRQKGYLKTNKQTC